jgi:NAD(P)H-dependent flavin oxidoreductase YrpB (nitropropane dioxygenase family)
MHTELCDRLGIEFPIFAFTHCRDVVAAVSNAGGLGVLGAVGFSPEQLEVELAWLDEHVGDKPYGVDVVIPGKYEGKGELDSVKLEHDLGEMIPQGHRDFVHKLLDEHHVPELPADQTAPSLLGWTAATAAPQIDTILRHPKVKLLANALGTPPDDVIAKVHEHGLLVAALCGSARQARNHRDAGVDIVIAQGTEGGGHTGEIGSMVLWPEVIEAVSPTPVLAAGGIGSGKQMAAALALGAQGVWTGSLWLTVEEADVPPAQMDSLFAATSSDTVRSRSWTGKPCRMLKNEWTEAWATDGNPEPLGMPLQFMVTGEAVARNHQYPEQAKDVQFNPVGQIVGTMTKVRRTKDVIYGMVEEAIEAQERLAKLFQG